MGLCSTCVSSKTSRSCQILRNWSCRAIVSHPMALPGTKLRSPGRITSALTHCTVFSAPNPVILVLFNFGVRYWGLNMLHKDGTINWTRLLTVILTFLVTLRNNDPIPWTMRQRHVRHRMKRRSLILHLVLRSRTWSKGSIWWLQDSAFYSIWKISLFCLCSWERPLPLPKEE